MPTKKEENEVSFAASDVQNEQLARVANTSIQTAAATAGIYGEIDDSDIKVPYLTLVQKMSESDHPRGAFVFNKDIVIGDGSTPTPITVLNANIEYQEVIPYEESGNGVLPRRFPTKKAVLEAGLGLRYEDDPKAEKILTAMVLVPVPAEYATFDSGSPAEVMLKTTLTLQNKEEIGFARALWILRGSAFTSAGKQIISAGVAGHLKDGLYRGPWSLTSEEATFGKNKYYKPILRPMGTYPEEVIQWLESEVIM